MAGLTVATIAGREQAEPDGAGWRTVRTIAFDDSYATNGESLTKEQLGFSKSPDWVEIPPKAGYVFEYVGSTTEKVKVYRQTAATSALVEVANAVDLSALTGVVVKAYGRFAG